MWDLIVLVLDHCLSVYYTWKIEISLQTPNSCTHRVYNFVSSEANEAIRVCYSSIKEQTTEKVSQDLIKSQRLMRAIFCLQSYTEQRFNV